MILNGHYALRFTKHACFGAYNENIMKTDPFDGGEDVAQ